MRLLKVSNGSSAPRASPLHIHYTMMLIYEWAYLFRNLDGAVGEGDALAEALGAAGHSAVPRDADVLSMDLMEQHWWQVVGARLAARVARGCKKTLSSVFQVETNFHC